MQCTVSCLRHGPQFAYARMQPLHGCTTLILSYRTRHIFCKVVKGDIHLRSDNPLWCFFACDTGDTVPIQGTALMIALGQANTRLQGKFTAPLRLLSHAHLRCKPAQSTPNIDELLAVDLEAPEIAADMQSIQEKLGATFEVSLTCSPCSGRTDAA